jgi:glycosyltransferase involved in cell wall biosynthesis
MVSESPQRAFTRLTVFTPAYNRAKLLPRLFESIRPSRKHLDFLEWLVIDDGSVDSTEDVVRSFQAAEPGLIQYVRVPNGGKHRAMTRAAQLARGDWVMVVDSDDYLAPGALLSIQRRIEEAHGRSDIGLLRGLKTFPDAARAQRFRVDEQPALYADWLARQPKFDTAEVIRKSALAQHPFPDFDGEHFMAESWLWHRLDRTHRTIFINEPWIVCYYQSQGLTASAAALRASCACGATAVYAEMLRSRLPLRLQLRAATNWWRYRFHARHSGKAPAPVPDGNGMLAPAGWLLYCVDRFKFAPRR